MLAGDFVVVAPPPPGVVAWLPNVAPSSPQRVRAPWSPSPGVPSWDRGTSSRPTPTDKPGILPGGFSVAAVPTLRLAAVVLDQTGSAGNANGHLTLRNVGAIDATDVAVRLGPTDPLLKVEPATSAACADNVTVGLGILVGGIVVAADQVVLPVGGVTAWRARPRVDGTEVRGRLGAAIALANVDGDGVADLLIGAPGESTGGRAGAGRVVARSGRTDDPLWTLDGDEVSGQLGAAIAGVGDLTGDGTEDLLVGAPGAGASTGMVHVVSGRTAAIVQSLLGPTGSRLGAAVARAGDADLDGRDELVAAAPWAAGGAGLVLRLAPDRSEISWRPGQPGERLGAALAHVGDMDLDGLDDAVLGAPEPPGSGRVVSRLGNGSVTPLGPGAEPGESFGSALASGKDVDSDGSWDIAIGSTGASSATGPISVVSAARGSELWARARGAPGDELAASVGPLPDLDGDSRQAEIVAGVPGAAGRYATGDGFPDLIVGAPTSRTDAAELTGRAVSLTSEAACEPVAPCANDGLEPNGDAPRASPVSQGTVPGLAICRDDVDVLELAPPAGRRVIVRALFRHADTDIDLTLHDGAAGGCTLAVLDPHACAPTLEIEDLRARKAPADGDVVLTWSRSRDACHRGAPPRPSCRVFAAPAANGSGPLSGWGPTS